MSTPGYAPPRQAAKYTNTGRSYESTTYGSDHLQLYRDIRNEEIGKSLRGINPEGKPLRILEVGCGTGMVLQYLLNLPEHHEVCGLDGSEIMLEQASERFENNARKPDLSLGSADSLPFPDAMFDAVIATRFIHLFEHDYKKRIFTEFRRILKNGGITIVEFYARPYAWYRYRFADGRGKPRDSFFSHYPTRSQVADIVDAPVNRRPIRLVGSRVLHRLIGGKLLCGLTRFIPFRNLNPLVDEYLVVTRK